MDETVDEAIANEHHDGVITDEHEEQAALDDPQHGDEPVEVVDTTTPAEAERRGTEIIPMVTTEVAALIKATINPDLTDAELILFAAVANRVGLDPLARQIYAVKRRDQHAAGGKRMTIQTGIDGFRLIARRTGRYAGRLGPYFCGVDGEWRTQRMPDGSDAPAPWLDTEPPAAALVGVVRVGDEVPTYGVAKWVEYRPPAPLDTMWIKMPTTMLGKCAEAQAIRACFPAETSGLYTDEEMMQADAIEASSSVVVAGGNAYSMSPREVREALVARQMDATGKIDAMRDRLAAAIAQETAAGEGEKPPPAVAAADVDGDAAPEGVDEPAAPETHDDSGDAPADAPGASERVSEGFPDAELIQKVANEVKPMPLSTVMRELAQRDLDEGGPPDAKRKRLAYALYLEAGGTPAHKAVVPEPLPHETVDTSKLPLDESGDDEPVTS